MAQLSLSAKINAIVVGTLALGLGAVAVAYTASVVRARQELTSDALNREAEILYSSIENFMMVGEAPVAIRFFSDLRNVGEGLQVALYRRDGMGAFVDNQTIETVNHNLMRPRFEPKVSFPERVREPERPYFDAAAGMPPESVQFRWEEGGRSYERLYRPLLNLPKCTACHGSDHTVRGVIDLRTDITQFLAAQRSVVAFSAGGAVALLAALAALITRFIHTIVVRPVRSIGKVCGAVTSGDFTGRVEVARRDELGSLAETVNRMVEGLYERYELTKYVSRGTLSSIAGGQEPKRVQRTLLFSDVRGFTSYTERHGADAIVGVLNKLLDAQAGIIQAHGGDIDKFVGDEVVAVFSGDDAPYRACQAALDIAALRSRAAEFDGLMVGMGIASGSVVQGMVGSKRRADFTVIGDPVNIAARLCSAAKPGQTLVCDCSYDAVKDRPELSFLGPYKARLKGKAEAQRVYLLKASDERREA
jgi:class 3 adenylate cyclase